MGGRWREKIAAITNNVCRGCAECDGYACRGEVPGLGGCGSGSTFQANYQSWREIEVEIKDIALPKVGVAPMTGVDNNMGAFTDELSFQKDLVYGAQQSALFSCIGDGHPDYKLLDSARSLRAFQQKGVCFIKPYQNNTILERYSWIEDAISMVGVDVDAHILATMAGKTVLERKTASQLKELKKSLHHPFVIKGIFQKEDIELVQEVRPDAVVVSNHGGRVKDHEQGIAYVLQEFTPLLRKYTGQIWVDGGLRRKQDLLKAAALGADSVLIGRPFIQGVAVHGKDGVPLVMKENYS